MSVSSHRDCFENEGEMQTFSGTSKRVEEFSNPSLGAGVHSNRVFAVKEFSISTKYTVAGELISLLRVFFFTGILKYCFLLHDI